MNVARLAMQEIRAGLRNRWVVATTLLLAALSLSLALLGSAPTGVVKADPLAVVVVSLASLTIFLVPLIADRKSVVEGKSVSVRVDLGGSRIIKKKKNK